MTGAGSGIGRATAILLGRRGATVGVHYRANAEGADAVVKEIEAAGSRAASFKADVSRREEVDALAASTEETLGPVEVLVNNAGSLLGRCTIL